MLKMLEASCRPQQDHLDFVSWRRRDLNKLADFLCNQAMDEGKTSNWRDEELMQTVQEGRKAVQMLCFSDGGLRGGAGVAASAWIAFVKQSGRWLPLSLAKTYFGKGMCKSSFTTETVALDVALIFAMSMTLRRRHS